MNLPDDLISLILMYVPPETFIDIGFGDDYFWEKRTRYWYQIPFTPNNPKEWIDIYHNYHSGYNLLLYFKKYIFYKPDWKSLTNTIREIVELIIDDCDFNVRTNKPLAYGTSEGYSFSMIMNISDPQPPETLRLVVVKMNPNVNDLWKRYSKAAIVEGNKYQLILEGRTSYFDKLHEVNIFRCLDRIYCSKLIQNLYEW